MFDPKNSDDCLGQAELTRQLVSKLDIPVIAAGGIMDGAGIIAALALGAEPRSLALHSLVVPSRQRISISKLHCSQTRLNTQS